MIAYYPQQSCPRLRLHPPRNVDRTWSEDWTARITGETVSGPYRHPDVAGEGRQTRHPFKEKAR
jgi:hypothetical protein